MLAVRFRTGQAVIPEVDRPRSRLECGFMSEYTIKPLGPGTWDAFAQLAGRNNGVWNGCWCTWFHTFYADKDKERTAQSNRDLKERLVNEGRAHAALVFDGDVAVAWCQYG